MNRRDQREQAFILIFERTINNDTIAQIVENAGESRDLVLSAFAEKVATGVQNNAVSYTHLDVYKRQTVKKNKLNKILFFIIESTGKIFPVLFYAIYFINFSKTGTFSPSREYYASSAYCAYFKGGGCCAKISASQPSSQKRY